MHSRWIGVFAVLALAACAEQVTAPASVVHQRAAALVEAPIQLANGGTSSSIFAKAISPHGWILGNFYLATYGPVRSQSWSPYPDLTVNTVRSPGSIYSGTDGHGDVAAHGGDEFGPVVYFADAGTKGQPYSQEIVPTRSGESPGNTIAHAINDDHVVVGWTVGSAALVWLPTATGRSWALPIDLPRPYYPGGYGPFDSQAHGINNAGFIVGQVGEIKNGNNVNHAVLWRVEKSGESWTTTLIGELPRAPRITQYRAHDINDAGVISGVAYAGRGESPALWFPDAPGIYTRPPTVLSGILDWAVGKLNSCGWLAFTSMGKSTTDAYVWNGTTTLMLPRLTSASGGRAYDVSDQGDVVGGARFTPKSQSAYGVAVLWRGAVSACP